MKSRDSIRLILYVSVFVLSCSPAFSQQPSETATVHLKFVDSRGEDLGVGTVTLFQDGNAANFAGRFKNNVAADVPFGSYHLKAFQQNFYTAERITRVYQREVWAVIQLTIGQEGGPLLYHLAGTLTSSASSPGHFWIRAQGLYSDVIVDGQADKDGKFEIAGLPAGTYILSTRDGENRILNIRSIIVPPEGQKGIVIPLEIRAQ